MDLGTGLALFGAKDLLIKILGPSADYLGNGLKEFGGRLRFVSQAHTFKKALANFYFRPWGAVEQPTHLS